MGMRKNNGFTLIELVVAMAIIVLVFGLVTFLYTKAARIRKIVVVNNEVQQTLSQIIHTLTYGDKAHWGISDAERVDNNSSNATSLVVTKNNGTDRMTVNITPPDITVSWTGNQPETITLNIGRKVEILLGSGFTYLDPGGNDGDKGNVSFIKIILWARSTDPSFRSAPAVPLVTGVKLSNKTSF
ncbi:MAG: type II secretion system protein [Candidatus Omnitrophica bacterium]|nr:type II secretion system protein [Candidatus Omnitrophota bacterium]